jgi:cobalt transporter subunit CbtB
MNTLTVSETRSRSGLAAAFFAAFIGFSIVSVTGLVQADTLHNAAHDVRHANGFPCH